MWSSSPLISGPSIGASKLQSSICDAEATSGALKIPLFFISNTANRDILGRAADFLQPRSRTHRAFYRPFKMRVQPTVFVRIENRPLLGRNTTNGKRSLAGVTIGEPQYGLLKIAHVPGIFSMKQVIADCLIEFRGPAIGTSLP